MPIENIYAMIIATLILNLSPGPDMLYIIGRTITQGAKMGFAAALGVSVGALFHATAATLGLSAIFASSELLFNVVKILGAGYLIFLGVRALLDSSNTVQDLSIKSSNSGFFAAFKQGMLTNVLNPKVALFFIAFFPQFLAPSQTPEIIQLFILSVVFMITAIIFQLLTVVCAHGLAKKLIKSTSASYWVNRIFGGVLIALGLKLLFANKAGE